MSSNIDNNKNRPVPLTHAVKLVLLGDSGVGKTSLAFRFVHNSYQPFVEATIGATYLSRNLVVQEQQQVQQDTVNAVDATNAASTTASKSSPSRKAVELKIWDTAGQERYQSLTPLYFRGAGAALLVYDVTKLHSYQTLQRWVRELQHGSGAPENVLLTIVGNKYDLAEERTVLRQDAQAYAESIGAVYMEASAKTGENVLSIFESIALRVSQQDRFLRPPDALNDVLDLSARRSRYLGTSCCY